MSLSLQVLFGFGCMVVLSLAVGSMGKPTNASLLGYFWGDSSIKKKGIIALLLSSPFSMNGILYQTWLGYRAGLAAVLIQVIWCASYIWLAKYSEKLTSFVHRGTLHGNIGDTFGIRAEKAAAIASLIGFTLQIGWELIVGVSIFTPVVGDWNLGQLLLILLIGVVAAIYTIVGGLKGNSRVNELQNLVAGIALWFLVGILIFVGIHGGKTTGAGPWDSGSLSRLIDELTWVGLVTNIVFSLLWQFVDMSTWQSLAGGRKEEGKASLYGAAFWIFIFPGVVGTFIGMYLRSIGDLTADGILNSVLSAFSSSPWMVIFVAAGFVAAMLSTIDGLLLASTQAATWDLFHKKTVERVIRFEKDGVCGDKETPGMLKGMQKRMLDISRFWTIGLAVIGGGGIYCFTKAVDLNIFDLVYIVIVAQMILFPSVFALLRHGSTAKGDAFRSITYGLITGFLAVAAILVLGKLDLYENYSAVLPYAPIGSLLIAFLFFYRTPARTV